MEVLSPIRNRHIMKYSAIATALVLVSGSAFAHSNNDHCDINFDGRIQLENNVLTVYTQEDDKVIIDEDKNIYVNGNELALSGQEQEWVANYYDGITTSVPIAADIAVEGVAIATEAVGLVFGELLGANSSGVNDLTYKLEELGEKVQYNFYAEDGTIRLDSEQFEDGNFLGEEWEESFEESVSELVMSSMGHLMIAIGSEMLFNGGDMEAFEQRMENFGSEIEEKMEFKGEQLEEKAEMLCTQLAKVDQAERYLQKSVSQLADLDIIRLEDDKHAM